MNTIFLYNLYQVHAVAVVAAVAAAVSTAGFYCELSTRSIAILAMRKSNWCSDCRL